MADWIISLQTDTPQQGFELAIKLAQKGVVYTQPSAEIREHLRDAYSHHADSSTQVSKLSQYITKLLWRQIIIGNNGYF